MAERSLKQKLEDTVKQSETEDNNVDKVEESNIVPFIKNSTQILSVLPEFVITLNEAKARLDMLQEFVRSMMVAGVDYGMIPKSDKPSLFKSGGEKLCDIFGFSKQVEVINRLEDWEKRIFHYEIKVTLMNKRTGHIEAEGIGSCNNKERKYKNQDAFSIVNTILKMSKKRAFIDAVLSATRSSGLFTQDIEDLPSDPAPNNKEPSSSNVTTNCVVNNSIPITSTAILSQEEDSQSKSVSKSQLSEIFSLVSQKRIPIEEIKETIHKHYSVTESKLLTESQGTEFIEYLKTYNSI